MPFNILIVDDSPAMPPLGRVLDASISLGQRLEAGDGEEALRLLAGQWIDVVLTDLICPAWTEKNRAPRIAGRFSARHPHSSNLHDRTEGACAA